MTSSILLIFLTLDCSFVDFSLFSFQLFTIYFLFFLSILRYSHIFNSRKFVKWFEIDRITIFDVFECEVEFRVPTPSPVAQPVLY